MSSRDFQKVNSLRSDSYAEYHFLCHENTRKSFGWTVCSYALTGLCNLKNAIKGFDTAKRGTAALKRHSDSHNGSTAKKRKADYLPVKKLGAGAKRRIADASCVAAVQGLLPLSFLSSNPGMYQFIKTILECGQACPVSSNLDVADLIPSDKTVADAVLRLANAQKADFKDRHLDKILSVGGGITCDGLKQKATGKKYYDFVVHYFDTPDVELLTGETKVSLCSRVLLLEEMVGSETPDAICSLLDCGLNARYEAGLEAFANRLTFVTDHASAISCVFGASSSSARVHLGHKWMGCISHKLNTIMKKVIAEEERIQFRISNDLKYVKLIVRVFKHSSWKNTLPSEFRLVQEVEIRLGTTRSVVERFLKSVEELARFVPEGDSQAASDAYNFLLKENGSNGKIRYPALEAICVAFKPLRHVQTALEASKTPTLNLILPMLEHTQRKHKNIVRGMAQGENFEVPHELTEELCSSVLSELQAVEIHVMWTAGVILHLRLKGMSFINEATQRDALKAQGCEIIRKMVKKPWRMRNSMGVRPTWMYLTLDLSAGVSLSNLQETLLTWRSPWTATGRSNL